MWLWEVGRWWRVVVVGRAGLRWRHGGADLAELTLAAAGKRASRN